MASKREIAAEIKREYGNSLTERQVLDFIGIKDIRTGRSFINSLDGFLSGDGKRKRYLAIDVAAEIYRRQVRSTV